MHGFQCSLAPNLHSPLMEQFTPRTLEQLSVFVPLEESREKKDAIILKVDIGDMLTHLRKQLSKTCVHSKKMRLLYA